MFHAMSYKMIYFRIFNNVTKCRKKKCYKVSKRKKIPTALCLALSLVIF